MDLKPPGGLTTIPAISAWITDAYYKIRSHANSHGAGKSDSIMDLVWPIGSIYQSVNDTNPGTLFGGTWAAFGSGKVLIGVDTGDANFNAVEKTGGNFSHKHTVDPPSTNTGAPSSTGLASAGIYGVGLSDHAHAVDIAPFNSGTTIDIPTYITVYRWKRTA